MSRRPYPVFLIVTVVIFALALTGAAGGCANQAHKQLATARSAKPAKKPSGKSSTKFINPHGVVWVTVSGGVPVFRSKVLFKQNAADKIESIVTLINDATRERVITAQEVASLQPPFHGGAPIGLVVALKDGSKVLVEQAFEITRTANSTSARRYSDRFVVTFTKNQRSLLALSQAVPDYLAGGFLKDMPGVQPAVFNKSEYRIGDQVFISGDGCIAPTVQIILKRVRLSSRQQDKGVVQYVVARPHATFGLWQWKGSFQKEFTDRDGKRIILSPGLYGVDVLTDGMELSSANLRVNK